MPKTTTTQPAKPKSAKLKAGRRRTVTARGKATKATKPATKAAKKGAGAPKTGGPAKPAVAERLKPGELDGLVLAYLKRNAASGPHGPAAVARALSRSSGAVANCLVRLTRAEQVREVGERPRRYSLAA